MSVNYRRGPIPSELGWLVDELDEMRRALGELGAPDAAQNAGTIPFLAGLRTYGASGADVNVPSIPNDGVIRYVLATGVEVYADVPTGEMLITASFGEASMEPDGSFVIGYVAYNVVDVNNVLIPGPAGSSTGRFYTNLRAGVSISTGPQKHLIPDPVTNPGPYRIRLYAGTWAATLNGAGCTANFADPSLVVQVIGAGVAL